MKRKAATLLSLVMLFTSAGLTPAEHASAAGVELLNFDYDDNVYFSPSGSGTIALTEEGHSGQRSIKLSGRSIADDGAKLGVELAEEDTVYNVSMWVKSQHAQKLTAELNGEKVNSANLPPETWTKIEGSVTANGAESELVIYGLEGTGDFLIDDVSVLAEGQEITTPYAPEGINMFEDGGFESGELGVFAARGCTNTVTEAAAHSGKYGVSITEREQDWMGIETNIKDLVIGNANYKAGVWVKIDNPESVTAEYFLQLETEVQGGSTEYPSIKKFSANSDEWTEVSGVFSTGSLGSPLSKLKLYIGSADGNTYDIMVDDFSFAYTTEEATGNSSRPTNAKPWVNYDLQALKDVYADYFLLGNARSSDTGESGNIEDEMMAYHFDIMTAGNDMKPDYLAPSKDLYTFDRADTMVDNAIEDGMLVHGHVLLWHEQSPDWLTTDVSRDEALANMKDYIFNVMEHYKGKCYSWDVVNEAIDGITDTSQISTILRDTPWRRAVGDDFIEYAFRYAAEADPDADLYYNDFNLDDATKADAVVTLVKDLQSKGIKIDGIGMQGHYTVNTSIKAVENSIKKFAELGVKISISELDVGCLQAGDYPTEEEFIRQAQKYAELFILFKKYSDVIDRVTLWGLDDGTSWRAENYPLVFDLNYQPKEAYYALLDPEGYLEEHPVQKIVINRAGSAYGTPTIDGTAEALWDNVPEYKINRYVMAWQGASGTFKSMWDENNLYLLVNVTDPVVSAVASEAYLQDSVEAFVDENNGKTTFYEDDDAQYRVSCENVQSFGTNGSADKFKTAVTKTDTGYMVEMAIALSSAPASGDVIGFDVQINDDGSGDGNRTSIAKFNDTTDLSWGTTENWGELELNMDGTVTAVADDEQTGGSEAAEEPIKVFLNGAQLEFDTDPMIVNDITLVPFRALFEALGAEVGYEEREDGQYVAASRGDINITLKIDSTDAQVNNASYTLEAAPVIVNERTLVPLRFISESLGAAVEWNGTDRTITITAE